MGYWSGWYDRKAIGQYGYWSGWYDRKAIGQYGLLE